MDTVFPARRSQMKGARRATDAQAEIAARQSAHTLGFRSRLQRGVLPESLFIVLPGRSLGGLIHGGFWYRHEGCKCCYIPKAGPDFWLSKLKSSVEQERRVRAARTHAAWKVVVFWKRETRGDECLGEEVEMHFEA